MANCRVSACLLSLSLYLSLIATLYLSPRLATFVLVQLSFPPALFYPQRVVFIHRELANHRLAGRTDQIIREIPSTEAYTDVACGYTVPATRFAFEIIPVDTHARRLIALGFNALYSRTKETAIRSAKRRAAAIYILSGMQRWQLIIESFFNYAYFFMESLLDSRTNFSLIPLNTFQMAFQT